MKCVELLGRHLVPSIVVWHEDFTLNEQAYRQHLRYLLSFPDISSVVFNAQAGEGDSLTREERLKVLMIGLEEVKGRAKAVATVSPTPDSTAGAVSIAKDAEKAGADAILLMPPRWFGGGVNMMPETAIKYVQDIAASISLPIIVFQLNPTTWIHYTVDVLTKMCRVDGVIGIKAVTRDVIELEETAEALHALPHPVTVYTGNDIPLFHDFIAGADGTLLGNMNVFPGQILKMFAMIQEGNLSAAWKIHKQLLPLNKIIFALPHLAFRSRYKLVAELMGLVPSGRVRPPLPEVGQAERLAIHQALTSAGLLKVQTR